MALARRVRKAVVNIANGEPTSYDALDSYCAIASHFFVSVAKRYGYKLDIVEGVAFERYDYDFEIDTNHCWVQYQGKIIDLTATQFGVRANIHIVNDTNKKYHAVRKNQTVIDSLKHHWPKCQTLYDNQIRNQYKTARRKVVTAMETFA
jgi:hypothetical protein